MKELLYASATENLTFYKFFNLSKNSFKTKVLVSIKTSLTISINCFLIVINHGQSSYWTAKSSFLFLASDHTEADPNYTLRVDFWTMIFYNLKNSG